MEENKSIFKKFPIEKVENQEEREKEMDKKQGEVYEEQQLLRSEQLANYIIQLTKAKKEYVGKYLYRKDNNTYGKIVNLSLDKDGNIGEIFLLGFQDKPEISVCYDSINEIVLRNFEIDYPYEIDYGHVNNFSFISKETYQFEKEKYKEKILNFIKKCLSCNMLELESEKKGCEKSVQYCPFGYISQEIEDWTAYILEDGNISEEDIKKEIKEFLEKEYKDKPRKSDLWITDSRDVVYCRNGHACIDEDLR